MKEPFEGRLRAFGSFSLEEAKMGICSSSEGQL